MKLNVPDLNSNGFKKRFHFRKESISSIESAMNCEAESITINYGEDESIGRVSVTFSMEEAKDLVQRLQRILGEKDFHDNGPVQWIPANPIRIIQQESGKTDGVQQHANRPGTFRTYCGVRWMERDGWNDYRQSIDPVEAPDYISCQRCLSGIRKENS